MRFNKYASISECGRYRYELGGDIGTNEPLLRATRVVKVILWIMLNPSTADDVDDDNTIRNIVGFSERWGYNRLMVGNLYAFRTKSPEVLMKAMKTGVDVVGPLNNIYLTQMVERVRNTGGEIMAAWGGNAKHDRVNVVRDIAGEMRCLRVNGDGSPVHPLYQPRDLMPTIWPSPTLQKIGPYGVPR